MSVVELVRHIFGAFGIEGSSPLLEDRLELTPPMPLHPFLRQ